MRRQAARLYPINSIPDNHPGFPKNMNNDIFFNTQHSPIGSFASFTLGAKGAVGGLGLELGKPADQNVFIGIADENSITCLPFFQETTEDDSARFDVEAAAVQKRVVPRPWAEKDIRREFSAGSDTWSAGDLTFSIHTPVMPAPDPGKAVSNDLRLAYVPALTVELTVDNTRSKSERRAIFGFQGNDPVRGMPRERRSRMISRQAKSFGVHSVQERRGPLPAV